MLIFDPQSTLLKPFSNIFLVPKWCPPYHQIWRHSSFSINMRINAPSVQFSPLKRQRCIIIELETRLFFSVKVHFWPRGCFFFGHAKLVFWWSVVFTGWQICAVDQRRLTQLLYQLNAAEAQCCIISWWSFSCYLCCVGAIICVVVYWSALHCAVCHELFNVRALHCVFS